jgi:hypothetical protein
MSSNNSNKKKVDSNTSVVEEVFELVPDVVEETEQFNAEDYFAVYLNKHITPSQKVSLLARATTKAKAEQLIKYTNVINVEAALSLPL